MRRADWGLGCGVEFILRVYILTPGESTDAEVADVRKSRASRTGLMIFSSLGLCAALPEGREEHPFDGGIEIP